jgi:hypothetical protein
MADDFTRMNIMAGTAKSFVQRPLTPDDLAIWNRDFDLLISDLSRLVDPEIGADLAGEKAWYTNACAVAKGYCDDKPLGGLKSTTGQFGFRLITPQDLTTSATSDTPAYYSWRQTLTMDASKTKASYAFGYNSGAVYAQNVAQIRCILAFHRLISYTPDPRLIAVEFNVNDSPYAPYSVEPFAKIAKGAAKLYKIIPMPGRILLQPGGHFYSHFYFDLRGGATAPSGSQIIDVEIAPFGIAFGDYDYLASSNLT